MSLAARIICKRFIFALSVAALTGCSSQHSSLLPNGSQTSITSQARIVSKTIHTGGKTYVIDELTTPTSAPLQAITAGPDGHIWFAGGSVVGKSSVTGDMTDYLFPAYSNVGSIVEGPDRNLWVALQSPGAFGKITPDGGFDAFALPEKFRRYVGFPVTITKGPGADLWAIDDDRPNYYVIRITTDGKMNGYKLPQGSLADSMTEAADGTLWISDFDLNAIEHMTKPGVFKQFSVPTSQAGVNGICQAADGSIWFTETNANKIGEMTADGKFREFTIPTASSKPLSIVAGPDGAMWFTETIGQIGRVTTSGSFTELPVASHYAQPFRITVGSDKNIWFTEYQGTLGRVELNQLKDSQPKYSSFTLSLELQPQLGVPQSIPLKIQVKSLTGKVITGKYPYPVHLTTSDAKNAALSLNVVTSSATKVHVKFSGRYTDTTIGASANGGGALFPAIVLPSTPMEEKLTETAFNLAGGSNNSVWMCLPDGKIAERSSDGSIYYYPATNVFEQNSCSMVEGPDGNVWFTDYVNDRIGSITPQGQVSFRQLHRNTRPERIALGSDGALWFTEPGQFQIARMTTDGHLQTYRAPQTPNYFIAGPDGNLWYDDTDGAIYKLSTSGVRTKVSHSYETSGPLGSANGFIWFLHDPGLAQMTTDGKIIHNYSYSEACIPLAYASTPDGDLWYYDAEHGCIGRLTPSGVLTTVPTFSRKTGNSSFGGLIYGPKNDLWFAEPYNKGLGRLDPTTM